MLNLIKLVFALFLLVGLLFVGAGIGFKDLSLAIDGASYSMFSGLGLAFMTFARL